jgi:uncharacterized membrane protein HdeD (DUF308 family)
MSMNQSDIERLRGAVVQRLHDHWKMFLVEGIVLVILGVVAVGVPVIATMAIAILVGWLFLVSGTLGLVMTFWMRQAPGFWWSFLSGILGIAAGFALLAWPPGGVLSLTFILIFFFTVEGVASIMFALDHKRELFGRWGWMLASGIVDLILAGLIVIGLPGTAAWAIGLLVGINMIFGGTSLIAMALHARTFDPRSGIPAA